MEVVTIDGVEYLKAKVAAKRFKYTSDYIGQLCRGKKIDAKLVGRTWYINPLSLETHKSGLYAKNLEVTTDEKASEIKVEIRKSRIDVPPVVRKDSAKLVTNGQIKSNFARRIDWKPVKYEPDTSELLPNLVSALDGEKPSAKIKVDMADSEKVQIKNSQSVTQMVAEPLPVIALAGSLKIQSINDDFKGLDFDERLENIVISEETSDSDREIDLKVSYKKSEEKERVNIKHPKAQTSDQKAPVPEISEKEATYQVEISHRAFPVSFTPSMTKQQTKSEEENFVKENTRASTTVMWPYLVIVFLGLVSVLAVSFIEVSILASPQSQDLSFIFSKVEL